MRTLMESARIPERNLQNKHYGYKSLQKMILWHYTYTCVRRSVNIYNYCSSIAPQQEAHLFMLL